MTRVEKLKLCKALYDAQMPWERLAPQVRATVRQQYDCIVNALLTELVPDELERRQVRGIINMDNWLARDNPFKDDAVA